MKLKPNQNPFSFKPIGRSHDNKIITKCILKVSDPKLPYGYAYLGNKELAFVDNKELAFIYNRKQAKRIKEKLENRYVKVEIEKL